MGTTFGLGSVASAIGNVWSSNIQAKQNEKNVQDTIAAQKEAAKYENLKNIEQWERVNAYNSPTEQMARLKEGGLNPAMIYGSGGAKTTATEIPKYQAPRPDYSARTPIFDPGGALGAFQDFQVKNGQINNLDEQNKVLTQEARIKEAEADQAEKYYHGRGTSSYVGSRIKLQDYHYYTRPDKDGKTRRFTIGDTQLQAMQANVKKIELTNDYQKMMNKSFYWKLVGQLGATLAGKLIPLSKGGKGVPKTGGVQLLNRYGIPQYTK